MTMDYETAAEKVAVHLDIDSEQYRELAKYPILGPDEKKVLRDTTGKRITSKSILDRFLNSVDTDGSPVGKWEWTGPKTKTGLLKFNIKKNGKTYKRDARWMVYLFATGLEKKPKGFRLKSFSDDPNCVNPFFMYLEPTDVESTDIKRRKKPSLWARFVKWLEEF